MKHFGWILLPVNVSCIGIGMVLLNRGEASGLLVVIVNTVAASMSMASIHRSFVERK